MKNHIFFVRCYAVEAFLVLRDKRSGETPQAHVPRRLTARPAESEQPEAEINNLQKQQRLLKQFYKIIPFFIIYKTSCIISIN
jgi:hypothetical protein